MRIAVLIKQVPEAESLTLGPDGRLVRAGLALEMNPYCRRAVAKGVELARGSGGRCLVVTLGPPASEDALREAVAWGADEGVLVTDPVFAGSDTLATSRAMAATLEREGPFDLVLVGRNSVDADTGQVGPQLAEMLGLPFLGGVKALVIDDRIVRADLELDDGWARVEVDLPAVLSCAERLCDPAKVDVEGRAAVAADRIRRVSAAELGSGPWGQAGSATVVGETRVLEVDRRRIVLSGDLQVQVEKAVALLEEGGALRRGVQALDADVVPDAWNRGTRSVLVVVEPERPRVAAELLTAGARLAEEVDGVVVALVTAGAGEADPLGAWGADRVVVLEGAVSEEDVASGVTLWCADQPPWAVLAPGTMWGREVAARVAVCLDAGLVGDAVGLSVHDGRLAAWKPAFGGRLVASVTATSPTQMVTVRPGVLSAAAPRAERVLPVERLDVAGRGRVRVLDAGRDDDVSDVASAAVVVGVGNGVDPEAYDALQPLLDVLGADLVATRKVTDRGWQPRSRQVGITGRSIAPQLYVGVGLSGRFNHMVGVRGAGMILAINRDPEAEVFHAADVGIVADWREGVAALAAALARRLS